MRSRVMVLISMLIGQCLASILLSAAPALATSGGVLISELQTNGASSGQSNYEFVELYNSGDTDISLKGWIIEYRSASTANGTDCSKGWTKSATLPDTTIKAHKFFLLADKNYPIIADSRFSLDLASTAGTIHILDGSKHIIDTLAWGDDTPCGAGTSAPIISGQSLERLPGVAAPLGGNGFDTGNNQNDFALRTNPEPQTSAASAETPLVFANVLQGDPAAQLKLSELLINPSSAQSAFVEFQNTGPAAIVLSAYTLKVGSASYYLPHLVIPANGYTTLHSDTFPLTLPANNGAVSLIDAAGTTTDAVTWDVAPADAALITGDSQWTWTAKPTPNAANESVAVPEPVAAPPSDPGLGSGPTPGSPTIYPIVEISELLPDPASPATDASDEFIELHNPNTFSVSLAGYTLKTGHNFSSHFTLPSITVAPGGYVAFTSAETHLALSNSGSDVGLFDPLAAQIGSTTTYGAAKTGDTWAQFGSGWAWTTTPTPGAPNILTAPPDVTGTSAAAAIAKKAKATSASQLKAATAKTAVAKAAKPSKAAAAKKTVATKVKAAAASLKPALAAATSGPWVLIVLVGLTICYGIYEFRYDLRNYYHQLRGHTGRSSQPGPAPDGRGDDRTGQRSGRGQDDLRARPGRGLGL